MQRSRLFWILALVITVVTAYVQRVTGPTYPVSGTTVLASKTIQYKLPRSHGGNTDATVEIQTGDSAIQGYIDWKRDKSRDSWTRVSLKSRGKTLAAELPHQPPAGKLQYRVVLFRADEVAVIPAEDPLVIRFKGEVPLALLVPHIIAMFLSMLLAARAGLEYFNGASTLKTLTYWTVGSLLVGGFVLGPFVQHYAFGAWWTGWPYGYDLTDNKTALAMLAWLGVLYALKRSNRPRMWALVAAVIMFAVYLIPHSLLGSEIDYTSTDRRGGIRDTVIAP